MVCKYTYLHTYLRPSLFLLTSQSAGLLGWHVAGGHASTESPARAEDTSLGLERPWRRKPRPLSLVKRTGTIPAMSEKADTGHFSPSFIESI